MRHIVELDVDITGRGTVKIDGIPLKFVTGITVYTNVGSVTEVQVTFIPEKVLAHLDADTSFENQLLEESAAELVVNQYVSTDGSIDIAGTIRNFEKGLK